MLRELNRLRRLSKGNPSYSQEGEDLLLDSIFFRINAKEPKDTGFYVDVGAHHPYIYSNTARMFKRGWSGINIDPSSETIRLFNKVRPKDKNLRTGVGTTSGELTYFKFSSPALNTFNEDVVAYHTKHGMPCIAKETIPIEPLSELLEVHLPSGQNIDFMNVDVEGFDYEVVQSNNWDVWRPTVVAIEQHSLSLAEVEETDIGKFFKVTGYVAWSKTASTIFYVEEGSVEKLR